MSLPPDTFSLVADIGGTNTRVALARGREVRPDTVRRYANTAHSSLEEVLRKYVKEEGDVDTRAACVAVAGPVRDGAAKMTNLDWAIDKTTLAMATRAETVAILNDLQAQGHALGHIAAANIRHVIPFPPATDHAARLVIGVGTGFNAAPVFETDAGRVVTPSESGHVNLPVATEDDMALARFLATKTPTAHGFASVEDALSGRGLENLYRFHAGAAGRAKPASDIMSALADGTDDVARRTVETFSRMLGAVAGNLALTQLPFGGVYLIGGVARALAPYLADNGFVEGFRAKGRFGPFMESFGVAVIEDDNAALTGSAAHLVALGA